MIFALLLFSSDINTQKYGPWTRAVTAKDDKGIEALYDAAAKASLEELAELHDFPMYMSTDGEDFEGGLWSKEDYIKGMKPFFATEFPAGTKHSVKKQIFFNSNEAATVIEEHTQVIGKTTSKWITTALVIKRAGKWRFKTMFEAGWAGDITKK